jgi:hypothetical protein
MQYIFVRLVVLIVAQTAGIILPTNQSDTQLRLNIALVFAGRLHDMHLVRKDTSHILEFMTEEDETELDTIDKTILEETSRPNLGQARRII